MTINRLINRCAEITLSKGFDVSQHNTQIVLIGTEVSEALECLNPSTNPATRLATRRLLKAAQDYELYRKLSSGHQDTSTIRNMDGLLEEMADILIRVFSWIGGNSLIDRFIPILVAKIEKNAERPYLHSKGF